MKYNKYLQSANLDFISKLIFWDCIGAVYFNITASFLKSCSLNRRYNSATNEEGKGMLLSAGIGRMIYSVWYKLMIIRLNVFSRTFNESWKMNKSPCWWSEKLETSTCQAANVSSAKLFSFFLSLQTHRCTPSSQCFSAQFMWAKKRKWMQI